MGFYIKTTHYFGQKHFQDLLVIGIDYCKGADGMVVWYYIKV